MWTTNPKRSSSSGRSITRISATEALALVVARRSKRELLTQSGSPTSCRGCTWYATWIRVRKLTLVKAARPGVTEIGDGRPGPPLTFSLIVNRTGFTGDWLVESDHHG